MLIKFSQEVETRSGLCSRRPWGSVVQIAGLIALCCTATIVAAQPEDNSSKSSQDQGQQCAVPQDPSRLADARDDVRVSPKLVIPDQNELKSRTAESTSETRVDDLHLGSLGDKDAAKPVAEPECKTKPNPNLNVTFQDGRLAVVAHNVPLSDVLEAISSRIGAQIDFPPGSLTDPVFVEVKPTNINTALTTLLEGTNLNYVVLASSIERRVQRVIITNRLDSTPPDKNLEQAASAAPPPHAEVLYQQSFRVESSDDSQTGESVAPESPGEAGSGGSAPALSDRAKMLDELQKRQLRELDDKAAQAERK